MARFSISLNDSLVVQLDSMAKSQGVSRSQMAAIAIDSFITGVGSRDEEFEQAKNELNHKLHQTELELNQCQTDVMKLNRQIANHKNQIAEKDQQIKSISNELVQHENQHGSEMNQIQQELNQANIEMARFESALRAKDGEIDFLHGHVAQLTQSISQFALKPGEEEIKKKGWWKFWK